MNRFCTLTCLLLVLVHVRFLKGVKREVHFTDRCYRSLEVVT